LLYGIVGYAFLVRFLDIKGAKVEKDNRYIHSEREAAKRRHPAYQSKKKTSNKKFNDALLVALANFGQKEQS